MELKLNVYKNQNEVEKTYAVDSYDLMTGTTEEFLNMLNLDNLLTKSDDELIIEIIKIVVKNFKSIYPLAHDMFGITEDEYKRTKVKELANVLFSFLGYALSQFGKLQTKN